MLPLASEKPGRLAFVEQDKTSCESRAENAFTKNLANNASNLSASTTSHQNPLKKLKNEEERDIQSHGGARRLVPKARGESC